MTNVDFRKVMISLSRKYEVAKNLTLDAAIYSYEERGIALVITDGNYVQIENEVK